MSIAIDKALRALEDASGDPEMARQFLHEWAQEKGLRTELLDLGIGQAVSTAQTLRRQSAVTAGVPVPAREDRLKVENGIGMRALERGLYDFPLPKTGKMLGDATRQEVLEAKNFYGGARRGMEARERFLGIVAMAAKDPKLPIKKQVRAEDLGNMWSRAEKEAAAA